MQYISTAIQPAARAQAFLHRRIKPRGSIEGERTKPNDTHKVYPDGADVAVRESVVRETQQQTRFAHAGIADQHQLEEVITAATQGKQRTGRKGGVSTTLIGSSLESHNMTNRKSGADSSISS